MRLADKIAVGMRGTSPVSAKVSNKGIDNPTEVKKQAKARNPNIVNGRLSFNRTSIDLKIFNPSGMVLSLLWEPSGRSS